MHAMQVVMYMTRNPKWAASFCSVKIKRMKACTKKITEKKKGSVTRD